MPTTDFVVIGSGIAGLRASIDLVTHGHVVLITKADSAESNTGYAQGGIAAALGPGDSPEFHKADTVEAGAGLCDPEAVDVLVREGPRYVRELLDWGARFDRQEDGRPALGREGAHSVDRVLHARDATGREIGRTLWRRVAASDALTVLDHARATRLLVDGGRCRGVEYLDAEGRRHQVHASGVLLATGGAGQVYQETTNPAIATGDGLAMAWRAGARVGDLEFVQFHPTVLGLPGTPRFLVSEAVRGEGARLVNSRGEAFMPAYDARGDLAPRDVVAIAMMEEAARTGHPVFLSLKHLAPAAVHDRFPGISAACRRLGLDLALDLLPVSPAAHYICGGVDTDLNGRTSIPGLFAAGEVACTRVHGANRLASNSLLEGLVFGARAAAALTGPGRAGSLPAARVTLDHPRGGASDAGTAIEDIPGLMWRDVGLMRDSAGLTAAVATLSAASASLEATLPAARDVRPWRQANIAGIALLIARAALSREESRGGHRRRDFPDRDDLHWRIHIAQQREPWQTTGPLR